MAEFDAQAVNYSELEEKVAKIVLDLKTNVTNKNDAVFETLHELINLIQSLMGEFDTPEETKENLIKLYQHLDEKFNWEIDIVPMVPNAIEEKVVQKSIGWIYDFVYQWIEKLEKDNELPDHLLL